MTFRYVGNGGNCNGCEWFTGEGNITSDTPKDFRAFLEKYPYKLSIYLDSPGGHPSGMELGREIRKNGISTHVGRSVNSADKLAPNAFEIKKLNCSSACALAFLGGVERSGGPVNFHQASLVTRKSIPFNSSIELETGLSIGQFLAGVMIAYVIEMDVDPRLITKIMSVPPTSLYSYKRRGAKVSGNNDPSR